MRDYQMNRTVTLVRYARLENGWRRGAVVMTRNGKLKHPYMIVKGQEVQAPQGRYQIVRYDGKRPIYTDVGNDPTDALARCHSEESTQNARVAAVTASLEIVEPEDPARPRTIRKYAEAFVEMHKNLPHRSSDSVAAYTLVTSSFLAQCHAVYPGKITQDDVIRWAGWLREDGYSDRSRANYYIALRGFLRYCGVDPAQIITKGTHKLLKQYTKRVPNTYTPEQVQALIEASIDKQTALLWDFLYKTGLRRSEVEMVTRDDLYELDSDHPTLHVRERDEYGLIKDAEERIIELHPSLVPRLKAWLKGNPGRVLLFGTDRDKVDRHMLRALKRTAYRAGMNCGRCAGCKSDSHECNEFTLHRFRRTFTTRLLRATGGDLRSVMGRTGHSDLASVMRYLEPAAHIGHALAKGF